MDLRQLRVFVEIVRQGSFTLAAEHLNIAQPAVSITIRKLEDELDLTLLNRNERRITLTSEGESLLRHAERILDHLASAETEMAEFRGLTHGEVRIGIPPMMSSYYFPQIIRDFHGRYPNLKLSVNGEGAARIQRMIAKGDLDMGVIAGQKFMEGLEYQRFLREEIVACVPLSHPLAARDKISLAEFLLEPLILFKEGYYMDAHCNHTTCDTTPFQVGEREWKHDYCGDLWIQFVGEYDMKIFTSEPAACGTGYHTNQGTNVWTEKHP